MCQRVKEQVLLLGAVSSSVSSPQGYLLYRDTTNHSMSAIKINPETLEHEGTVTMPGEVRWGGGGWGEQTPTLPQ